MRRSEGRARLKSSRSGKRAERVERNGCMFCERVRYESVDPPHSSSNGDLRDSKDLLSLLLSNHILVQMRHQLPGRASSPLALLPTPLAPLSLARRRSSPGPASSAASSPCMRERARPVYAASNASQASCWGGGAGGGEGEERLEVGCGRAREQQRRERSFQRRGKHGRVKRRRRSDEDGDLCG